MPTAGDVWRIYVKPSLNGLMVFRKRNTIQTSPNVAKIKTAIAEKKPAIAAHGECEKAGLTVEKYVYVPGKGWDKKKVCPIQHFRKFLRKSTLSALQGVATSFRE